MIHTEEEQKLLLVEIIARDLMEKHRVSYLDFKFSNDKSALGWCSNTHITVQKEHALIDSIDDVINTILHEIAHTQAGLENNHNTYWEETAKELGVQYKYKKENNANQSKKKSAT